MPIQLTPEQLALNPEWAQILAEAPIGGFQQQPAPAPTPPAPGTYSNVAGPTASNTPMVPYPAIPGMEGGNPLVAQHEAQLNLIQAQQNEISLREAKLGLLPEKRALDADVLQAQTAANKANMAYLNEQDRANQQRIAEEKAIQAAKKDVKNIKEVAGAEVRRNDLKYRYQLAGISTPIEVNLPEDFNGQLPPGVVKRLRTLADILTEKAGDADALRKFRIEAARIKSANLGLKVTEAQIKAGKYALTLEEAEEALDAAGLVTARAQLNLTASGLPPPGAAGKVWDETTNSWVTPLQASQNQREAAKQLAQNTYGLGTESPAQLKSWATARIGDGWVMDIDTLRSALQSSGMQPASVEFHIAEALAERARIEEAERKAAERETGDTSLVDKFNAFVASQNPGASTPVYNGPTSASNPYLFDEPGASG